MESIKPAKFSMMSDDIATTAIWLPFTTSNVRKVASLFTRRLAKQRYGVNSYQSLMDLYPSTTDDCVYHVKALIGNKKAWSIVGFAVRYTLPKQ